ncbi:MAG: precorrin-3B C(17)-methyltransferase [Eubacteriales bacterium]|nr:precorrin-3B C(17)-methyltransferase [Eubacteriales bacterium]
MAKLYIVGLGPGAGNSLTFEAQAALEAAEVLVGYTVYIELIREAFLEKEIFTTGMRGERERCLKALEFVRGGQDTALVCSGDAGVYGLAGLSLELAGENPPEIEIIPGVTAALAGAAKLGAPLTHDFAVISLSDLLTPWDLIEQRLRAAAAADFSIVLYNPASRKRKDYLQKACELILSERSPETPAGYVRMIGRPGESIKLTTLGELGACQVDMFTTVFIGNSQTKLIAGRMVTPRGYKLD